MILPKNLITLQRQLAVGCSDSSQRLSPKSRSLLNQSKIPRRQTLEQAAGFPMAPILRWGRGLFPQRKRRFSRPHQRAAPSSFLSAPGGCRTQKGSEGGRKRPAPWREGSGFSVQDRALLTEACVFPAKTAEPGKGHQSRAAFSLGPVSQTGQGQGQESRVRRWREIGCCLAWGMHLPLWLLALEGRGCCRHFQACRQAHARPLGHSQPAFLRAPPRSRGGGTRFLPTALTGRVGLSGPEPRALGFFWLSAGSGSAGGGREGG